jgi:hypothetical protein
MREREDLTGQRFEFLKVIELDHVEGGHGYWVCECLRSRGPHGGKCGRRIVSRDTRLKTGRTVSCGCAKADPEVRRTARMQVPSKRRRELAALGGKAARQRRETRSHDVSASRILPRR